MTAAKSFLPIRIERIIGSSVTRLTSIAFLAAIGARLAQFTMAIVLARSLAPSGFGVFTFAVGAGLLAGQLGTLGWPVLASRFIPAYRARSDWGAMKGLLASSDLVVLASAVLAAGILWGTSQLPWIDTVLGAGLALSALVAIPMAFRNLRRQQLAALGAPGGGLFLDEAVAPIVVLLCVLTISIGTESGAVVAYAGGSVLGVIAASLLLRRRVPGDVRQAVPEWHLGKWAVIALPAIAGISSKAMLSKTDVLMLAPLADMEAVGLYGAAFRVTYFLTFPQVVLATVMTPRYSAAIATGDGPALRRRFFGAYAFAGVTGVPAALILVLLPGPIMGLIFGQEFVPAAPTLTVLAVAMAFGAFSIPAGGLLLMGGRERLFGYLNAGALALNVAINFLLIPEFGAFGAAIATLISALMLFAVQSLAACQTVMKAGQGEGGGV